MACRRMFAGRVVHILPYPIREALPESLQETGKEYEVTKAREEARAA